MHTIIKRTSYDCNGAKRVKGKEGIDLGIRR